MIKLEKTEVAFLDDKKNMNVFEYDFSDSNSSVYLSNKEWDEWIDNDFSKTVPSPDSEFMTIDENSDTQFWFTAYEFTRGMYESYGAKCFDSGYTEEYSINDTFVRGKNDKGYTLQVYFDEEEEKICVRVETE